MYGGNSLLESKTHNDTTTIHNQGRFPANLIHDGSQEVLELFPESGEKSPSRFFYSPKASKKDRDEGLEQMEDRV